jgi:hypothetical protein
MAQGTRYRELRQTENRVFEKVWQEIKWRFGITRVTSVEDIPFSKSLLTFFR